MIWRHYFSHIPIDDIEQILISEFELIMDKKFDYFGHNEHFPNDWCEFEFWWCYEQIHNHWRDRLINDGQQTVMPVVIRFLTHRIPDTIHGNHQSAATLHQVANRVVCKFKTTKILIHTKPDNRMPYKWHCNISYLYGLLLNRILFWAF